MLFCISLALMPATVAAQVGKLPALAPLANLRGDCRSGNPNAALARLGVRQINVFLTEKGGRRLSVATGAPGQIISFSAVATKRMNARRTENEFASAIFAPDGTLQLGTRSFSVTTMPASSAENQERRMTPQEGKDALALARTIAQRCPATR
jgi:hypothetical protein